MPSAAPSSEVEEPLGPLPPEFAAIMRPELPSLIKEIRVEVTRTYPEFARLLDGPNSAVIRLGVEQSLAAFVDRVAEPTAPAGERDELCRRFGRFEAYEGRSLDSLHGAYRIGARIALRRAKRVGRKYNLSPTLILTFADALFAYVDELEALSREGYLEVQSQSTDRLDSLHRRILHLLLAGHPLPGDALTELCEQAGWRIPERVTLVALRAPAPVHLRTGLDPDVLADLGDPQPHLLIPGSLEGPDGAARLDMLTAALGDTRCALGLTVPTARASDSIRWARRVLELIDEQVIADGPAVRCADHLTTLWLLSDPALLDRLAALELAPLSGLTGNRRARLLDTLRVWLTTRGTAEHVGDILGVHAQTVRYRLRNLDAHFGDRLTDPERRFATEAALRARHLQGHRHPSDDA
ncbi:helix-turn-helix domain-containing protein [Streptomyces sp. NPDC058067]|uniref:helix-turn-helix domain-containing protein n=1 Tax=Streptomyces sp. NPDC058067 TaxID=3346324 RepID=UPI0036E7D834